MRSRALIFSREIAGVVAAGAVVMVVGVVRLDAAQSPVQADPPEKAQAFMYENALRSTIELGGQKLAQQALVLVPELSLATNEPPIVRGVKLDGYGFIFDVQAPDIQSSLTLWDMVRQSAGSPRQMAGGQQVSVERATATSGPVAADPMSNAPAAFDATKAYTAYVREVLIYSLVDNSVGLALGAAERLTIVASGIDQPNANPLYRARNMRKLILTITGSDLQDYRQGRITRDQVKQKIIESRF